MSPAFVARNVNVAVTDVAAPIPQAVDVTPVAEVIATPTPDAVTPTDVTPTAVTAAVPIASTIKSYIKNVWNNKK